MIKTRPEDKPKAIALIVAIVLISGFTFWNTKRAMAARQQVAAPATQVTPSGPAPANGLKPGGAQPTGQPMGQAGTQPGEDATTYAQRFATQPGSYGNPEQIDPFRAPMGTQPGTPQGTVVASGPTLTPMGGTPSGSVLAPMAAGPPPLSQIQLKGVVSGGRPMAVIKVNDTTFNVYKGDTMLNKLYVENIGVATVVLRHSKRRFTLSVGDGQKADVHVPQNRRFEPKPMAAEVNESLVGSYQPEPVAQGLRSAPEPKPSARPVPPAKQPASLPPKPDPVPPAPVETAAVKPVGKELSPPPPAPAAKPAKAPEMGPI